MASAVKPVFTFIQFINAVIGGAALAVGIFVLVDDDIILDTLGKIPGAEQSIDEASTTTSYLKQASYILIIVGGVLFVIGFCGCCGAIKESKLMLYTYAFLVCIILAAEVAGFVVVYLFNSTVRSRLKIYLNDTIREKYEGLQWDGKNNSIVAESKEPYTMAWDAAMVYYKCCGNTNYTNFKTLPALPWPGVYQINIDNSSYTVDAQVPVTCCKLVNPSAFPMRLKEIRFANLTDCLKTASNRSTNRQGCYEVINEKLLMYSTVIYAVGIAVTVIEIAGIITAFYLIKNINYYA